MSAPTIGIVGGSFGGMTAAISLKKVAPQANITIFEKRDVSKPQGAALGLEINALKALKAIDEPMLEEITAMDTLYSKQLIYDGQGGLLFENISEWEQQKRDFELKTYGISSRYFSWYRVSQTIRKHVQSKIPIIFGIVTDVNESTDFVELKYSQNGQFKTMQCDLLIAADGRKSSIRTLCSHSQFMGSEPTFQNRVYIWGTLMISNNYKFEQPLDAVHQMIGTQSSLLLLQPEKDLVTISSSQTVDEIEARGYNFDTQTETFRSCSSGDLLTKMELLVHQARVLPEYLQEYIGQMKEEELILRGGYFHTPQTWSPACYGQGSAQVFEDSYHLARIVQKDGVQTSLGGRLGKIREKRVRQIIEEDYQLYETFNKEQKEKKDRHEEIRKFEQDEETHKFFLESNFERLP
eukprot:TRINITY_DN5154_c0_g1_i5.p1 TRINITY_DN5154_c0_g1~~TRINITY_DN5154_c0_g1_i5.p1  ORF type:complete len:408 (+),score=33.84 TRINITY_DN5154_c0_g1_i5:57-1280(+)